MADASEVSCEDWPPRSSALRMLGAFGASGFLHASVIVLAVFLGRRWVHPVERPLDEAIRITLVEPPPLDHSGSATSSSSRAHAINPDAATKPSLKAVVRRSRNLVHQVSKRLKPSAPPPEPSLAGGRHEQTKDSTKLAAARSGSLTRAPAAGSGGSPNGVLGSTGVKPIPVSVVAFPPVPLRRVTPAYPMQARINDVEGEVVVEVILDRQGDIVGPVRVIQSIPLLDQAAVEALKQWRFTPARDGDGHPVPVILDVPLHFELD
jgi:periplasmic protein TonB